MALMEAPVRKVVHLSDIPGTYEWCTFPPRSACRIINFEQKGVPQGAGEASSHRYAHS